MPIRAARSRGGAFPKALSTMVPALTTSAGGVHLFLELSSRTVRSPFFDQAKGQGDVHCASDEKDVA